MTPCLVDTNILLYLANSASPENGPAKSAVARMLAAGDRLVIAPQILYEFWRVATRPAPANGLGWTASQTRSAVDGFRGRFTLLAEPPEVIDLWLDLVAKHDIKGKRVHDAHLLATMKANGISRLLTFTDDFPAGISGFTILSP